MTQFYKSYLTLSDSRFFNKFSLAKNTQIFPKLSSMPMDMLNIQAITLNLDGTAIIRFGARRESKRVRGAGTKVAVFGILKRGRKVYTQTIIDTKVSTLLPIIRDKIEPDSVVYRDNFQSYSTLDVSKFKHYRIQS